jgi:negative regulator of replication initiation
MALIQKTISFSDPQYAFLNEEANRLGISVSDVVRRILDVYRESKQK